MRFKSEVFRVVLAFTISVVSSQITAQSDWGLAQSARVLVQSSPLAGFRHHAAAEVWDQLALGSPLDLIREPDNPHDRNAVRVDWAGQKLGYVPRRANAALAWALDRGAHVNARISVLREHRDPRQRLEFEVFAE